MSRTVLTGADIILSCGARVSRHMLVMERGRISAILPQIQMRPDDVLRTLDGGLLLPGFIDVQVNGGGGVLFNDAPTVDTIVQMAAAHRQFGTTGFLPTLISDDLATVAKAIAAVDAAIDARVPGVLGIHLEGPFLNSARKGVHDAAKFRTLDRQSVDLLSSLKRGKTLVTLAPETTTPEMIATLKARGVVVAAGHSDASYEQMIQAHGVGVTGVTHLFNAMTQLTNRAPGVVGAALDSPEIFCGLIADGYHVHPASMRVALAAKTSARLMLVTDAMPSVGAQAKGFELYGEPITVADGKCLTKDGTLAGSDLDMASAVRNAITLMHTDIVGASVMASGTPAAFLGLSESHGGIAVGRVADLVWMDEKHQVRGTWIDANYCEGRMT
jgi:N-acetylglucosamine-6-phosphate deacetylase